METTIILLPPQREYFGPSEVLVGEIVIRRKGGSKTRSGKTTRRWGTEIIPFCEASLDTISSLKRWNSLMNLLPMGLMLQAPNSESMTYRVDRLSSEDRSRPWLTETVLLKSIHFFSEMFLTFLWFQVQIQKHIMKFTTYMYHILTGWNISSKAFSFYFHSTPFFCLNTISVWKYSVVHIYKNIYKRLEQKF